MANVEISALPSKASLNVNDYVHIKDGGDDGDYKVVPSVVKESVFGLAIADSVQFQDLVLSGDLTVNGTTTTVDTDNLLVQDPLILLGKDNAGDTLDLGIIGQRASDNVGMVWDESSDEFAFITTTDDGTTAGNVSIVSYADLQVGNLVTSTVNTGQGANEVYPMNQPTRTSDAVVFATVNGRDVGTDGTKLDGIESGADVTDSTNVVAAIAGQAIAPGSIITTGDVEVGGSSLTLGDATVDTRIVSKSNTLYGFRAQNTTGNGVHFGSTSGSTPSAQISNNAGTKIVEFLDNLNSEFAGDAIFAGNVTTAEGSVLTLGAKNPSVEEGAEIILTPGTGFNQLSMDSYRDSLRFLVNSTSTQTMQLLNIGSGSFDLEVNGNVGIGVAAGSGTPLFVSKTGINQIIAQSTDTATQIVARGGTGTGQFGAFFAQGDGTGQSYVFFSNITNGERARVFANNNRDFVVSTDSGITNAIRVTSSSDTEFGGNVGVGTAPTTGARCEMAGNAVNDVMRLTQNTASTIGQIGFFNSNGGVGSITTSASTTAYNTSSDPRLKNFLLIQEVLIARGFDDYDSMINADFDALYDSSRWFKFKGEDKVTHGFDAHACIDAGLDMGTPGQGPRELNIGDVYETEEIPEVIEDREILDEDGNGTGEFETVVIQEARTIEHKVTSAGVDQAKAVPILLAKQKQEADKVEQQAQIIMEQQSIIAELLVRVAALEA